jgi:hypothetical protein
MENKIICRKCGGNHFTIKCGKEKTETAINETTNQNSNNESELPGKKSNFISNNEPIIKKEYKQEYRKERNTERRPFFKKVYRVKLAELPVDMTDQELMELTYDWGHIVKLKVLNYEDTSVAYIDFGYEEEANYFVEALDKTTFDYLLLSASRADSY